MTDAPSQFWVQSDRGRFEEGKTNPCRGKTVKKEKEKETKDLKKEITEQVSM
jgi:hypothetical protein